MRVAALCLAGIAAGGFAVPAFAHHSFAMFDGDKTVTLEGTIKQFLWTNPHAWVVMTISGPQGQPQEWELELPAPSGLARDGWLPRILTPGMNVTTVAHPLKNGDSGGALVTVTLPDGRVLKAND
jgi:hypothetical protein